MLGNSMKPLELLRRFTGINFTQNSYMYLTTAVHFAVKKYGRKEGSNGTSVSLTELKKGAESTGSYLQKVPRVIIL